MQKNQQQNRRIKARNKFLRFFPNAFKDETYVSWERAYKWNAHKDWKILLNKQEFKSLLAGGKFNEAAMAAVKIESRTNLLFSFEKMALRDAVKSEAGAAAFTIGLYDFLYSSSPLEERFDNYVRVVASLPRKQTRVLTWPLVSVFGFISDPKHYLFLKPNVTKKAALAYGFDFDYSSKPDWKTNKSLLDFAQLLKADLADWKPRDFIDIQSFIWVMGSDEYD